MAIKTYTEQLEEVQAAISTILTGAQSVSVSGTGGGRATTFASLDALQAREKWLLEQIASEARGPIRVIGVTPV
jgi:hypothetical protein